MTEFYFFLAAHVLIACVVFVAWVENNDPAAFIKPKRKG